MATKIYISPSNQKGNTYASGNTNEMAQCNRIAEALEKILIENGYEVKRAPSGQDMSKSIQESNAWGADCHIPIHTNAGGGKGPLVMVYQRGEKNLKYAQPIYDELVKIAPKGGGYGVKTDMEVCGYHLAEIRKTSATAVYCECEFHDNADLAKWIIANVGTIARAIAKGICTADGKTLTEAATAVTTPATLYRVQVGAFAVKANAEAYLEKLKKAGFKDAFITTGE